MRCPPVKYSVLRTEHFFVTKKKELNILWA